MKSYARRLTAALITCLLAALAAMQAAEFSAAATRPGGDWLDVTGAVVYTVLAVGCMHLIPWRPR